MHRGAHACRREECEALAKRALSFAKADETRVTINSGGRGNTRFAVNQISTGGDNYDATVADAEHVRQAQRAS